LSGSADPAGSSATAFFEYGSTANYGSTTAATALGSGSAPVALIANVSGLSSGTTYHYRLVVQSGGGIAATGDAIFTTAVPAPTVSTGAATLLSSSRARLAGSVNPNGGATSYWFEYGTTTAYGQQTAAASAGSASASSPVQVELTGLAPATSYHYRLVAQNSGGTSVGANRQVTMPSPIPLATSGNAAFVTSSGALLQGSVNPNGEATSYWFEYGATSAYGHVTPSASAGSGFTDVSVGASLSELPPETTYHFRLVAQSAGGTSVGADREFTTRSAPPLASTGSASSLTSSGALLAGSVNPNGGATSYWFEYGTEAFYGTQTPSTSAGSGSEPVAVAAQLTGLLPATTYHYRLVAQNGGGTSYGAHAQFTTASIPPTMETVSRPALRVGRLVNGTIPLALSWNATEGSGAICNYEVHKGSDAVPLTGIAVVETPAFSTSARPARGLYYGVGALACDGSASALAESAPVDLRLLQESASALRRGAGWARVAAADASGRYVLSTTTHGARLVLSFTGRSFGLVAPKASRYGAVSVSIDGGAPTRVSLYRASRLPQSAVFVVNLATAGSHKVVIRAHHAGSRRRVDVDAFAIVG